MIYTDVNEAEFLDRPNRFVARILINGKEEICHVKNTGRCKELLTPKARIIVQTSKNTARKTKFDLISVYKKDRLINIDSQAPNEVFAEWLAGGNLGEELNLVKPEFAFRNSRFDFYVKTPTRKILMEVKGVTLEDKNIALFPDAPTVRGVKHIETLASSIKDGYESYIVFVIQMKGIKYFTPNMKTHPAFGVALKRAEDKGVNILAMDCKITRNSIIADQLIPVVI